MADDHHINQAYAYNVAGDAVSPKTGDDTPQQQPGATGQPVMTQPVQWMAPPPSIFGVPPGLEYLTQVDQLLIHQQVELLEVVTGIETRNKYEIKNSLGQRVYFAAEESGYWMRQCCEDGRGFILHITDNFNQEVIRVIRDFKCAACCCWYCACSPSCLMEVRIEAPVGQVVGYFRQAYTSWKTKYVVNNAQDETVLHVEGPCWPCQCICCPKDIDFLVTSTEGGPVVGKVTKQWGGIERELFTNADLFGISFPMDLDVKMKAVLLGGVFLIDFMFFEDDDDKKH